MSWLSSRWLVLASLSVLACASEQPAGSSSTRTGDGDDDVEEEAADQAAPSKPGKTTNPVTPGADETPESCASIREDAEVAPSPIDVVWIIDTSGSMRDEAAQVQANIAGFMRDFEQSSADTRAVMITENDPALGSALAADPRYRFVRSKVGSRELYEVALETFGSYRDFLRPGALTHFVMVTDDNDRTAAETFRTQMEQQLGHAFIQHAIASEDVNGRPCRSEACTGLLCLGGAAAVGATYNTLADLTEGEKISICSTDWTEVFGRLRDAVLASALPCSFAIPEVSGITFDPALVAAVYTSPSGDDRELPKADSLKSCGTRLAWHYDDEARPSSIVLCAAACEEARKGGSIDIQFGCEPVLVQ
ncbi:MAG: hypothetical protein ABW252_12360 [Polyangiales bacterium]